MSMEDEECPEQVKYRSRVARHSWNKRLIENMSEQMTAKKPCVCNKFVMAVSAIIFVVSVVFLSVSVIKHRPSIPTSRQNYCLQSQCVQTAATLISPMDPTSEPCVDFYKFACGKWSLTHRVPQGRDSISKILILNNKLDTSIESMLSIPIDERENEAIVKAKTFYQNCQAEQNHTLILSNLRSMFKDLGEWPMVSQQWSKTGKSWEKLIGKINSVYGQQVIFDSWNEPDPRDPTKKLIKLELKGTTIDRQNFASMVKYYRMQYEILVDIAAIFGANMGQAKKRATNILGFQIMFSRVVNPTGKHRRRSDQFIQLQTTNISQHFPGIDWLNYFRSSKLMSQNESINVQVLNHLELSNFIATINSTDISTIYDYIIWKVLEQFLPLMSKQFVDTTRRFNVDGGQKERWRRCVEIVNSKMGLAVGALFANNHLYTVGTEQVLEIAKEVHRSFINLIDESDWMDKVSKQRFKNKIGSMRFAIGYPDIVRRDEDLSRVYAPLVMDPQNIIYNLIQMRTFNPAQEVDRWTSLSPITLNAIYDKHDHQLIFPAGMMQPPFFSPWSPKSLNYGGIGVIIGHEMIHVLDDHVFDSTANDSQLYKGLLSKESVKRFRRRSKCVDDHYENLSVEVNDHKNAKSENIADVSGVKIAFEAFTKWKRRNKLEKLLPGLNLNHEQLFFLNYAQMWCEVKRKDKSTKEQVLTHSPKHIRVLGPLSNSVDFSKVYSCSGDSRMNPKVKCNVW